MYYNYSKKMFTGRAKSVGINGDSNNQSPEKWSSTVLHILSVCF